jgi:glucosyl-3-phosphoglycerate phosphatase
MNYLKDISILKNRYFIIRHGESQANIEKKIISNPIIGKVKYGLTNKGRDQILQSIKMCSDLDQDIIVFCSDFLRTKESAMIVKEFFNLNDYFLSIKLRERFFGNWDLTSDTNYFLIWENDAKNPDHKENNVESVNEVLDRITSFIIELEVKYHQAKILLVSHGDMLQILQTAFKKIDPSLHRSLPHLNQAEIRELIINCYYSDIST